MIGEIIWFGAAAGRGGYFCDILLSKFETVATLGMGCRYLVTMRVVPESRSSLVRPHQEEFRREVKSSPRGTPPAAGPVVDALAPRDGGGTPTTGGRFHEGAGQVVPSGPPPSFMVRGTLAHFVDIQHVSANLVIDVQGAARVDAEVRLHLPHDGLPILDLDADIDGLQVNGEDLSPARLSRVNDPDGESELRVLTKPLRKGEHIIRVSYPLVSEHLKIIDGSVEFFQKATDLTPGYSEMFFPSNLQYDQYSMDLHIEVGNTHKPLTVFTNGELSRTARGFHIQFPPHFNTSSFYVHLTDPSRYQIVTDTYQGLKGPIPITVYGDDPAIVEKAMATIKKTMAELESDYGPYAHSSFTAWVLDDYPGGMEYNGATVTAPRALEHEIFHSWFARGVMPSGGNAGWIDEALARWRDRGYPRATEVLFDKGDYPQLGGRSPWARVTHGASYAHGSEVMSDVDFLLRDVGGLKPVLRELYARYQGQTINEETFLSLILEKAPSEVRPVLRRVFDEKLLGRKPTACSA